ncbi:hypothetical protein C9374_003706 [Naegleria lovaniensis]|uniref:Uncharacterized protein n=1 Tax=Naegleria lovaniensis TaxID=51637 RepID=A0AA88H853_NAELO|nr:uncharacterized protein C9374_003706 [Naegleria lovaniensis]KAG2393942.1 hypothetical protein C9374_003706 [Naegleria lovaniensis]
MCADERKELSYFNRLYFDLYVKDNGSIDSTAWTVQKRGQNSKPHKSVLKRKNNEKQEGSVLKKKKQQLDEPMAKGLKVNLAKLFDSGILKVGDDIAYKNDEIVVNMKIGNKGTIAFTDPKTNKTEIFTLLKPLMRRIEESYSVVRKPKMWNAFFKVEKIKNRVVETRLKEIREQYLRQMNQASQHDSQQQPTNEQKIGTSRNVRVTIGDLVKGGFLNQGDVVVFKGSRPHYATIAEGRLKYQDPTGTFEYFETVTTFKAHIKETGNAWASMVLRKADQEVCLQSLRDSYIEKKK